MVRGKYTQTGIAGRRNVSTLCRLDTAALAMLVRATAPRSTGAAGELRRRAGGSDASLAIAVVVPTSINLPIVPICSRRIGPAS